MDKSARKTSILLNKSLHDITGSERFHISVIKTLAELFSINPIKTPLHLDEFVCTDYIDGLPDAEHILGEVVELEFNYLDYRVRLTSTGVTEIFGAEDVPTGREELLSSMNQYALIQGDEGES